MSLSERLSEDLLSAVRSGDEDKKRTLRLLIAELKNAAIEAREELGDDAALAVLQRQARQRRDSIEEFAKAGRDDLVASEQAELDIIESYLPQQMSPEEIEEAARRQIEAVGATGPSDMGRVMGPLMKELSGRADGRLVNETVRKLLAS